MVTARELKRFRVPLLYPERGRLIDYLDAKDAEGKSLPVLCHDEHEKLGSWMIHTALEGAKRREEGTASSQISRACDPLRKIPFESPRNARKLYKDSLRELKDAGFVNSDTTLDCDVKQRNSHMYLLLALCETLIDHYILIAEVAAAPGSRMVVKFEYDSPYCLEQVQTNDSKATCRSLRRKAKEKVRRWLGHQPIEFVVDTTLAGRSESYHFRARAPRGHYVYAEKFRKVASATGGQHSQSGDVQEELVEYVPNGGAFVVPPQNHVSEGARPYSHLYVGNLSGKSEPPVAASVRFREIPMGSVGNVFLVASAALVALLIAGATQQLVVWGNGTHGVAASVIVALPGLASVWLAPGLQSVSLVRAPVSARIGLIVTGACSFIGAIMLSASTGIPTDSEFGQSLHTGVGIVWALLVMVMIGVTFKLGKMLTFSTISFWKKDGG